jgi:phage gp16-like protein
MPETNATIKLNLEGSQAVSAQISNISTQFLGLQLASGAASAGLSGLGAVSRTNFGHFVVGARAVDQLDKSLTTVTARMSGLSKVAGELGNFATNATYVAQVAEGVSAAAKEFSRIPAALAAIEASGVSTRSIQELGQLKDAFGGNKVAVDNFVNAAISRLGEFEKAAQRSGTILRSSVNFDASGQALRATKDESVANALSVQKLVNTKLNNSVTSVEALNAQYQVLSGGFTKAADSEKVLESALKLTAIGRAGGQASNPEDNAKALAKTMSAYGAGADQAKLFGAVINATVENGLTTIPELAANFGAVGNSANKAGIGVTQLGAATATLTSQGTNTAEALTGIARLADTIINKTPEASAELAKLSLNGQRIRFDVAEIQTKGLAQALVDLYKATGSNPITLAKIFPDTVSFRTAISLLSQDGERLKNTLASVSSASASSLDDVAAIAGDDRVSRMERLSNRFGEVLISIARSVAPIIEPGLNALEGIARVFQEMPDWMKSAIGQYIVLQVQFNATTAAAGELAKMLGNLFQTYMIVRGINLILTGQFGAQVSIIKELIVQKKGLLSVLAQIVGIDQKFRLGIGATTEGLKNQGIAANALARAQSGMGAAAAAAGERVRAVVRDNAANARAVATEIQNSRTAGNVVNAAVNTAGRVNNSSIIGQVRQAGSDLANSQTVQTVRSELSQFLARNPAIEATAQRARDLARTAATEVRGGVQTVAARTVTAARSGTTAVAENIAQVVTPTIEQRASQLAQVAIQAANPKLIARRNELDQIVGKTAERLEFAERNYAKQVNQLEKQRSTYLNAVGKLETQALTPDNLQKAMERLNKRAEKIKEFASDVGKAGDNLKSLRSTYGTQRSELDAKSYLINAQTRTLSNQYAPALAIEPRLARVVNAADRAQTAATNASAYAANLNTISPGTAEAIAAARRAELAGYTAANLSGRVTRINALYQSELGRTGAQTALLTQQGLASTQFGNKTVQYSTKGLEGFLYQNATAPFKALADGTLGAVKALGRATIAVDLFGIKLLTQGIPTAFGKLKQGGQAILEVLSKGEGNLFQRGIGAASTLGQRALPMIPAPLAGAVAPLAIAAAAYVLATKDIYTNKFRADDRDRAVATAIKQDEDEYNKFTGRTKIFGEIKTDIAGIKSGDSVTKLDPVKEKLAQLQKSGEITADQFGKLSESIDTVGKSGAVSADKMAILSANIDKLSKGDNNKTAQGIGDRIWDAVTGAPGRVVNSIGETGNFLRNTLGGITAVTAKAVSTPGEFLQEQLGFKQKTDNRSFTDLLFGNQGELDADNIIRYVDKDGSTDKLIKKFDAGAQLAQKGITDYNSGSALSSVVADKLKSGTALTSADLALEAATAQARIAKDSKASDEAGAQIKAMTETMEGLKDPQAKAVLQQGIDNITSSKKALDDNTAKLKQSTEAFQTYQKETIPALKTALTESNDLDKTVANARTDFDKTNVKGADGQDTQFVKSISVLRQESSKLVDAISQKFAIDNSAGANETAIAGLKQVRDNRITVDGVSGFRNQVADRLKLTDEIVKIQQTEADRVIGIKELENQRLKTLVTSGKMGEIEAQQATADASIEIARIKLAEKQQEIREYAEFPRKVTELEQQAAGMRIAIAEQEAAKIKAMREREFNLKQAQYDLQLESLKTLQSQQAIGNLDAVTKQGAIEIDKMSAQILKLYQDRSRLQTASPELDNQIRSGEEKLAQTVANNQTQVFEARMAVIKAQLNNTFAELQQPITLANQQLDLFQKRGELTSNLLGASKDLLNSQLQLQESALSNQQQLTGDLVKRSQIELTMATNKLGALAQTQVYEKQSLVLQLKLSELSLQKEENQIKSAILEQEKNVKNIELEQLKLDRNKSNSPEYKAQREELELQSIATHAQLSGLLQQKDLLGIQHEATREINKAKLHQNDLTQKQSVESAKIAALFADIGTRNAKITDTVERQNLAYTAQSNILSARSQVLDLNTKQLDNQTKLIQTQQGLASAITDERTLELNALSSLTTNEANKLDIAQRIATTKLSGLQNQLKLEQDVLEINIKQQRLALEKEKIEQQSKKINSQIDVNNARATVAKLEGDPRSNPREIENAKLTLQSKLYQSSAIQLQDGIIAQSEQLQSFTERAARQKFEIDKRGKLINAEVEFANTLPIAAKAQLSNDLNNAIAQGIDTKYFEDLAAVQTGAGATPNIPLQQFASPSGARINSNSPLDVLPDLNGLQQLGQILKTVTAPDGSISITQVASAPPPSQFKLPDLLKLPDLQLVDTSRLQRDAIARYQEFVVPTQAPAQPDGGKKITVNLTMTNDIKIDVKDGTETKQSITDHTLGALEQVLRRVKQDY